LTHDRVIGNTVDARFDPLKVEGSNLVVRRNTASASFDGYRTLVRDLAGQGVVTDNRAIVRRYIPNALIIEGARVDKRNEVVCTNPDPYQCTPESQE
jgi:hypothetical protein